MRALPFKIGFVLGTILVATVQNPIVFVVVAFATALALVGIIIETKDRRVSVRREYRAGKGRRIVDHYPASKIMVK